MKLKSLHKNIWIKTGEITKIHSCTKPINKDFLDWISVLEDCEWEYCVLLSYIFRFLLFLFTNWYVLLLINYLNENHAKHINYDYVIAQKNTAFHVLLRWM